jgi:hypothetical protein
MRAPCGLRVWAGPIVYLIALLGIWLLANESARSLARFAAHCRRSTGGDAVGRAKTGHPRFHPMLLRGQAETAAAWPIGLELPPRCY